MVLKVGVDGFGVDYRGGYFDYALRLVEKGLKDGERFSKPHVRGGGGANQSLSVWESEPAIMILLDLEIARYACCVLAVLLGILMMIRPAAL